MGTVTGHIAANFSKMISGLQNVKAARLKALAVSSRQRSTPPPEVPTVSEQGFTDCEVNRCYGWLTPAGTLQQCSRCCTRKPPGP